jgi:hypothetical protein
MKRIGVLLVVLLVLAWIGSRIIPRSEPAVAAAPTAVAKLPQKQAEKSGATEATPDANMTAAEKKAQQEKWFGAETIIAAERAVKTQLKDPEAAQFRNVRANYTDEFGVVACGAVNIKSEFGGYTGFRKFVFGDGRVILEKRDDVSGAWSRACL